MYVLDKPGVDYTLSGSKLGAIGPIGLRPGLAGSPTCFRSSQVRSGQVRPECLTCTFRASCCSARLSRVQVPPGSSVRDRGKKGGKE